MEILAWSIAVLGGGIGLFLLVLVVISAWQKWRDAREERAADKIRRYWIKQNRSRK